MDWLKSELGKQLSEFAQDVLASDPVETPTSGAPTDEKAPLTTYDPNGHAYEQSNRAYDSNTQTYDSNNLAYDSNAHAYTTNETNQNYSHGDYTQSTYPSTQTYPHQDYSHPPGQTFTHAVDPNQGYAHGLSTDPNQGYVHGAEQYSGQNYSAQTYSQNPYDSYYSSQPYSGYTQDRGLDTNSSATLVQPARSNTKETVKLYALINDLEIKNLELEKQLKASIARYQPTEDLAPLHSKIQELETQIQKKSTDHQEIQKIYEIQLEELRKNLQAEQQRAQTSEELLKEAKATIPTERTEGSEDLQAQCHSLIQEKASLETELADALASLQLTEAKSAKIQNKMDGLPKPEDLERISAKAEALEMQLNDALQKTEVDILYNKLINQADKNFFEAELAKLREKSSLDLAGVTKEKEAADSEKIALDAAILQFKEKLATVSKEKGELETHSEKLKSKLETTMNDLQEKGRDTNEQSATLKQVQDLCSQREQEIAELKKSSQDSELRLSFLNKTNEDLQSELKQIKVESEESIKNLSTDIVKEKECRKVLEENIRNFAQKDETQQAEIRSLLEKINETSILAQKSEDQTNSSQEVISKLQAEAEESQALLAVKASKIQELESQLTDTQGSSKSENQELMNKIRELKKQNDSATKAASFLQEKLFNSQEDVKEKAQVLMELQKENAQFSSKVDSLSDELSTAKAASINSESEVKQLLEKLEALTNSEIQLKQSFQVQSVELTKKQDLVSQLQSSINELHSKLAEEGEIHAQTIKKDLDAVNEKYTALENEKQQQETKARLSEEKLVEAQIALEALEISSTVETKRLEAELEAAQTQLSQVQSSVDDLEALKLKLSEEHELHTLALTNDLVSANEKLSILENEKVQQDFKLSTSEKNLADAQEALQALQTSLKDETNRLESELQSAKLQACQAQSSFDSLEAQKEKMVRDQEFQVQNLTKELDSLTEKIAAFEKEKSHQSSVSGQELTRAQEAFQALEATSSSEKKKLESELEESRALISDLKVQKEKLAEEKDRHVQSLKKELNSCNEKLGALETEKIQLEKEFEEKLARALEAQKESSLVDGERLTSELKSAKEQASEARALVIDLEGANKKLIEEQEGSVQAFKKELASLKSEKAQQKDQLEIMEANLKSLGDSSAVETERLTTELKAKVAELSEMNQKLRDQKTIIASTKMNETSQIEQLRESQATLASLTKELSSKTEQVDAALADASQLRLDSETNTHEISRLKKSLEESNALKEDYLVEFKKKDILVGELHQEIEDYGASVEKLKKIIQSLSHEKRALSEENDKMVSNIATMKTAVKAKLKEIEEENSKLKKHVVVLEDSHAELNKVYEDTKAKLKASDDEKVQMQSQIKALGIKCQEAKEELDILHQKLDQATLGRETFLNESSFQRQELESQVQTLEKLLADERQISKQSELAKSNYQSDLEKTLADLNSLRQDYTLAQSNLVKLQSVLEELQGAQSAEVEFAVEKLQREADARSQHITELEYRAALAETKLLDYSQRAKQAELRATEVQEKANEAQRLKGEVMHLNDQLIELSRRLRKLGGGEDSISREFVAGLFTRFASFPRGDPQKFEMLEVISAALRLSPEDQVEVGLVREAYLAHDYSSLRSHSQTNLTPTLQELAASPSIPPSGDFTGNL